MFTYLLIIDNDCNIQNKILYLNSENLCWFMANVCTKKKGMGFILLNKISIEIKI